MSYRLVLRKDGPASGIDWFRLAANYKQADINSIEDSNGANSESILTAIPSPFARLHLFQTAFNMVESAENITLQDKRSNHNGVLTGGNRKESPYHKMVSQCLDLWEIIFRFNDYKKGIGAQNGNLDFVPYSISSQMAKLIMPGANSAHQNIAKTINTFLTADAGTANFDLLNNNTLYFLTLNQKIIGCTSPLTFFFTPEDIEATLSTFKNITLKRLDATPFFTDVVPLHKRDKDFQIYVHRFISAFIVPSVMLQARVKPFFDYTFQSINYLKNTNIELYNEIGQIYANGYNHGQYQTEYQQVVVDSYTLQTVGLVIYQQTDTDNGPGESSDFVLKQDRLRNQNIATIPLMLIGKKDFPGWKYYKSDFDKSDAKDIIPFADVLPLESRTMPGIGIPYPCLYVNDFLEDQIILLEGYRNDGRHFFNGSTTTKELESFLLPVKDAYFDYFSIKDLKQNIKIERHIGNIDGKDQSYVKVILTIPVRKGSIDLVKNYVTNPANNKVSNLGSIIRTRANLAIFPFIKTTDPNGTYNDFYKIMFNAFDDSSSLSFFENYQQIPFNNTPLARGKRVYSHTRVKATNLGGVEILTVRDTCFDYIKLKIANGTEALIIPLWLEKDISNTQFSCAVDFGTTNTHVEIRSGYNQPEAFTITGSDNDFHIGLLGVPSIQNELFVPSVINGRAEYKDMKFPTRTATLEIQPEAPKLETLSNINICFPYLRNPIDEDTTNKVVSNLKWQIRQDSSKSKERVVSFFEELLYLIRNKILLGNGNPAIAKFVWFYPLSMTKFSRGLLQEVWANQYNAIFQPLDGNQAISITESEAPYYYLEKTIPDLNSASVLCIDIGGGTTDFVFFSKDKPQKATSVFFGANVLYGTGFLKIVAKNMQNALMTKYLNSSSAKIENLTDSEIKLEISKLFKQQSEPNNSVNFINLLFTHDEIFNFTDELRKDSKHKVLFLLYYGAIIYHAAQIMLLENIPCPQYICTSGNGSRMLNILDPDSDGYRPSLTKFTRCLLKQYVGEAANNFKGIKSEKKNPKEATCKGGIYCIDDNKSSRPIPFIIVGDMNDGDRDITYEELSTNGKLIESVKDNVLKYVDKFIELSRKNPESVSYFDDFGIQIADYTFIRKEFESNGITYIEKGLEQLRQDDKKESLKETLFFYPFIGAIHSLGLQINKL